jgi:hypothetical protein
MNDNQKVKRVPKVHVRGAGEVPVSTPVAWSPAELEKENPAGLDPL